MSSKNEILDNIKRHINKKYDMPLIDIEGVQYTDKITQFVEISKGVGGNVIELQDGEDINELIRSLYPDAKTIASNLKELNITTVNPDDIDDPHMLNGIDLGVVAGRFGVAENGCVWIPQMVRQKVVYFISEYLIIVINKNELVNNMHEAYKKIEMNDSGFGVFISGPSKTADIEQALVVGAHGAKGVTVILI